ncbi:MAG: polymerase [Proteobacteria bacterium]|nr:polymerase [Pseudomonadota bacterium]
MPEAVKRYACSVKDFAQWRVAARAMLAAGVNPPDIHWQDAGSAAPTLFGAQDVLPQACATAPVARVPWKLLEMLRIAACHDAPERWALLYRILWRWTRGDHAGACEGDVDGTRLRQMFKAVQHEVCHLQSFVRFREQPAGPDADGPRFVAWFEPAYPVLREVAAHFAQRMGKVSWLIATPHETLACDGRAFAYGPGMARPVDVDDAQEALWTTYYRNTFNPARLNVDVMRGHMPARFWKNLPEAAHIGGMVAAADLGDARHAQSAEVARKALRNRP